MRAQVALSLLLSFGPTLPLLAQDKDQQPVSGITGTKILGDSRFEIGLAFAEAIGSSSFTANRTVREYQEDGSFNSEYKVGSAPGGGIDLQYNFGRKLGMRLGAQAFSRKSRIEFEAAIPHPFYFAQQRLITGTQDGLGFSETAISATLVYRLGSGKWRMALEGGPAFFMVNATIAEKVTYGEVYPYDTATFSGLSSTKKKVSPVGFAAGVEIGRTLSNSLSVFAQGRFTQGSGTIDVSGQKVSVNAGGAQARLGLRLIVARKTTIF